MRNRQQQAGRSRRADILAGVSLAAIVIGAQAAQAEMAATAATAMTDEVVVTGQRLSLIHI